MSAQTVASEKSQKPRPRISLLEVTLLLLIAGCGLALLIPSLVRSRETARAKLCGQNLRRLDKTTRMFLDFKQRLPEPNTWPVELISMLQSLSGERRQQMGEKLFSAPRPIELTCPAHMYFPGGGRDSLTSHYVLIADRENRPQESPRNWWFRDASVDGEQTRKSMWYSGIELTPTAAEAQLYSERGPHGDARFMESTTGGLSRMAAIDPEVPRLADQDSSKVTQADE